MRLYFIRHGQSTNNQLWERTGSTEGRSEDPELTPEGQQQAEILSRFLRQESDVIRAIEQKDGDGAGFGLTHIYCSLMIRSVATGTILARALDLPLLGWELLHEAGGIWLPDPESGEPRGQPGKDRPYFESEYPDLVLPDTLNPAGWWNRPFETHTERPDRARRFLDGLRERHGGSHDRVAVVSHAGFYNHVLAALLHLPQRDGYWFVLNNAALTRVDFREGGVDLVYLNRVDFLPDSLIT
jgi:2,3-bisphosphoglycerate-dependent phosphoglycerate mutase